MFSELGLLAKQTCFRFKSNLVSRFELLDDDYTHFICIVQIRLQQSSQPHLSSQAATEIARWLIYASVRRVSALSNCHLITRSNYLSRSYQMNFSIIIYRSEHPRVSYTLRDHNYRVDLEQAGATVKTGPFVHAFATEEAKSE